MDRRDFLRSLFATAVATALPDMPAARAASLTDGLTDRFLDIQMNGQPPKTVVVQAMPNGWYRVAARFGPKSPGGYLDLDFRKLNGGKGLYVGEGDVFSWGNQLEAGQGKDMIFSGYFKPTTQEPPS